MLIAGLWKQRVCSYPNKGSIFMKGQIEEMIPMLEKLRKYSIELSTYSSVLRQLVRQQLTLRYRRTLLGYLWTLINPLLMMSVTAVVFSALNKVELKTFAVFLFAGMIPWNCFSSIVTQSGNSFIYNEGLIKKIYLPKIVFPLSIALGGILESIFSFIALFFIMVSIGGQFSWALIFIPFAYVLLFFFSLGIALLVSIATVFFRDLQYIINIVMQALFFLTPILYKSELIAGKVAWLIKFNPVVPFIELFRAPLYLAVLPSASVIMYSVALSCASMFFGLLIFSIQEKKIVFRL